MFICNMGKKVTLRENKKTAIIKGLHNKQTTLKIAKTLNRDHRTITKFVSNPTSFGGQSPNGQAYKKRDMPHPSPKEQRNF